MLKTLPGEWICSIYIRLYSPYNMVAQATHEQARIRQMKRKK